MAIHAIRSAGRENVSGPTPGIHPFSGNFPFHMAFGGVRSVSLWHDDGVLACALSPGVCSVLRAGVRCDCGPLATSLRPEKGSLRSECALDGRRGYRDGSLLPVAARHSAAGLASV